MNGSIFQRFKDRYTPFRFLENFAKCRMYFTIIKSTNFINLIVKILLLSFKIFENRLYCYVYSVILTCLGAINVSSCVIGFLNTIDISEKIVAFVTITAQLNGILLYISVLVYRNKLLELFGKLERKQENTDMLMGRTEVLMKNKMIWFFVTLVLGGTIYTLPVLFANIFENSFNDKRSLLIPFWFSCGDGDEPKTEFCWDIHISTRIAIQAANTFQSAFLVVLLLAYVLTFTLYGLVAGELDMQMEIIGGKVDQFNNLAAEETAIWDRTGDTNSCTSIVDILENKLYLEFLHIIKCEKFLHGCSIETVQMWKLYLSYFYGSAFLDSTLFIFGVITLGQNQKFLAFRAFTLLVMRLLMALILAQYSQNISHLNEDFLNIMSTIKWHNRGSKFCKIYLQVLILHQRSNLLKIAGLVELNLNCYARWLRTMYSFVNVILLRYG